MHFVLGGNNATTGGVDALQGVFIWIGGGLFSAAYVYWIIREISGLQRDIPEVTLPGVAERRARKRLALLAGIEEIDGWHQYERGKQFEEHMALHFRSRGWTAKLTPNNDYGADIILTRSGMKIAVQCKCYDPKRTVSISAVQEVVASIPHYHANRGMVVTNVRLTKRADELAHSANVLIWDRERLIRELALVRQKLLDKERPEHSSELDVDPSPVTD